MSTETKIDPGTSALLILDYQNLMLGMVGAETLPKTAGPFIDRLRDAGVTIGYVRVAFTDEDLASVPASHPTFGPVAANNMMRDGSPEAALSADLEPAIGDLHLRKTRTGAFSTTQLAHRLRDLGADTVVLIGVASGSAVLATALEASDRDLQVVVVSDLCADPDSSVHESVMSSLLPRVARVVVSENLAFEQVAS